MDFDESLRSVLYRGVRPPDLVWESRGDTNTRERPENVIITARNPLRHHETIRNDPGAMEAAISKIGQIHPK